METVHGTCVAISGAPDAGCLLLGPSGSGKSDLALRLMDAGASLVADDRVLLSSQEGRLIARAPAILFGLLEIRGLGVMRTEALGYARVRLVVSLVPASMIERVPERRIWREQNISVPHIRLDAGQPSAVARVRLAVRHMVAHGTLDGVETTITDVGGGGVS